MGDNRSTMFAAALLVVAIAAGAWLGIMRRPPAAIPDSPPTPPVKTGGPSLDVHVAGWVTNPGVVSVDEGAIVADAIAAAGGMRPGADADAVNLAAPLIAGQQVVVPGPHNAETADTGKGVGGLISLNRATEAELETLPGVGPVLAGRIVSHRESHGPFEEVEDLLQVPGIGEAKLASLRDLVQP